jgi:hypothetical protein
MAELKIDILRKVGKIRKAIKITAIIVAVDEGNILLNRFT